MKKTTTISLIILIICIVVSAFFVVFLDSLEKNNNIRLDLSFNSYATTSADTNKILKNLQKNVNIYSFKQTSINDMQLYELIKKYESLSSKIKYEHISLAENPSFANKFVGDATNPLSADSIIVYSPDTDRYKLLAPSDFLSLGYNINTENFEFEGLKYEKNLTEAIIYVSENDIPTVQILTEHGELNSDNLKVFTDFLKSNQYDVKYVDLKVDSLSNKSLLFIPSLLIDLSDDDLNKIQEFEKSGGSLLVAINYTDDHSKNTNYVSLLNSYGILLKDGVVMADENDKASYFEEPLYLLPYMQSNDILDPLIQNNLDVILMPSAKAFDTVESSNYNITPLLLSAKTSKLVNIMDISNTTLTPIETGEQKLGLLSEKQNSGGENSKMIVLGNTSMLTESFIYSRTFVSEFILRILNTLLPQKQNDLDIKTIPAIRPEMRPGSKTTGLILISIQPILILTVAFIVLKKRKHL